jgi:hypothetical protein
MANSPLSTEETTIELKRQLCHCVAAAFAANFVKGPEGIGKRGEVLEASYSRVEGALVWTYGVHKRDFGRFRARITFLQKGGVLGVSPGKGNALSYTPDLLHRLIFSMELAEVGVTPAATLGTVADLWERKIRGIFRRAEKAAMVPSGPNDEIMMLGGISLMVGAWTSTAKALPNVNGFPLHKLAANIDLLMRYSDPAPRALVVNLSERLRTFHAALAATAESDHPAAAHPKAKKGARRRKGAA